VTARGVVVAVDGGGSKTDIAVMEEGSGAVLARHRGPGCSHHELGAAEAVRRIDESVLTALASASTTADRVVHAGCYLTAIDLPEDEGTMAPLLRSTAWGCRSLTLANDLFALLRAGTREPEAAVVVCGSGINGLAVRSDGSIARIPALGRCSGDWGGATDLVEEALWLAARAEDGRGRPTALRALVLAWSGTTSVREVAAGVHRGSIDPVEWRGRVPEIFAAARDGDEAARALVHRQGREIALLAASLLARLGLEERTVPIVVGGGIGASGDPLLMAAVESTLADLAPSAIVTVTSTPPIDGAIALAMER